MRCLCYEDCVCGTPVININPNIEAFAEHIRLNELQRVNKRLDFLGLDEDLPPMRGNSNERPSGLRYLLWELLIILGPVNGNPSKGSLKRVPNLLQSVMDILITYHSSHFPSPGETSLSCTSHANDYNLEHQADVSYYLCIIGNTLRSCPSIFSRLIGDVPDFGVLVFKGEPPPLLFQEEITKAYFLAKIATAALAKREYLLSQTLMLELFSPYHQWLYLVAPMWIEYIDGFEINFGESMFEDSSCRHCLDLIQNVTSRAESQFIWGYSTLESMMITRPESSPERTEQDESDGEGIHVRQYRWMTKNCFPGIILGTLTVSQPGMFTWLAHDYLVDSAKLETVSGNVLDCVFRVLVYHFDRDERMGRILFHDYFEVQYSAIIMFLWLVAHYPDNGSSFFDGAIAQSWFTLFFIYLDKKTFRSRSKSMSWYDTFMKYRELYVEYGYRPRGRYRRYFGALFHGAEQKMEVLERIGCMNWECKTRVRLETIKKRMNEEGFAVQDLAAEDKRLLASFKKVKLCSRCHNVAYCSRECQKADWTSHRPFCRRPEKDMTRNAEESAELIRRGWTANDEGVWPLYLLVKVGLDLDTVR